MFCMRLLSAAAMVAFLTLPASAEDQVEEIEGWIVTTRTEAGQKLEPVCLLASPGKDAQPRLQLMNWAASDSTGDVGHGAARIDFIVPLGLFAGGAEALSSAVFSVPEQREWTGVKAKWVKLNEAYGSVFAVLEESVGDIIQPMARGYTFELKIAGEGEGETFSVDLAGSSRALGLYEKCLAKVQVTG